MFLNICWLSAGLAALTLGAEGLVRGSASLAVRAKLTPLIIGLTVVAFGTSTPELVVSLSAAMNRQADISVGNVVGSNIFNIGIILGFTALLRPVKVNLRVIKHDGPILIAVSVLSLFLLMRGSVSRPAGFVLLSALIAYIVYTVRAARKGTSPDIDREFGDGIPSPSPSWVRDLLFISGGLMLLIGGSRLLILSAVDIARYLGVSEATIGLTIIAAGTSMPELATSVVAALRRHPDIAVGNIIGSNIFNLLGILGAASMVKPLTPSGVTNLSLVVMVVFSIVLLPLLYTDSKLHRWEGMLLLLGYGAYMWFLWPR